MGKIECAGQGADAQTSNKLKRKKRPKTAKTNKYAACGYCEERFK